MTSEREQRVKDRAYAIWEQEGRSDGQHQEHWVWAEAEVSAEERIAPDEAQSVQDSLLIN